MRCSAAAPSAGSAAAAASFSFASGSASGRWSGWTPDAGRSSAGIVKVGMPGRSSWIDANAPGAMRFTTLARNSYSRVFELPKEIILAMMNGSTLSHRSGSKLASLTPKP